MTTIIKIEGSEAQQKSVISFMQLRKIPFTDAAKIEMLPPKVQTTLFAAKDLYDNRLGHRPENPLWSAPQDFWKKLGAALSNLI